jgi:hypothetical protein
MSDEELEPHKLIAHFMSASAPLERYLQQGRPLTALQLESISLTIDGLVTYLDKGSIGKRETLRFTRLDMIF